MHNSTIKESLHFEPTCRLDQNGRLELMRTELGKLYMPFSQVGGPIILRGLAVTAAECCTNIGASLDLNSTLRPELMLFHEGPSRVLISTAEPDKVAAISARHGVEAPRVGTTMEKGLEIRGPAFRVSYEGVADAR